MIALARRYLSVLPVVEKAAPVALLLMRVWIANVFWKSGLTKIASWETTVSLFADEYKVPVLPPELAATLATAAELACPVLLVFGLGARFGALALLCMTAVIEFTYMSFPIHQVWATILLLIVLQGPGRLSVDHFIRKKLEN
jgi:putative oxidoreductase